MCGRFLDLDPWQNPCIGNRLVMVRVRGDGPWTSPSEQIGQPRSPYDSLTAGKTTGCEVAG